MHYQNDKDTRDEFALTTSSVTESRDADASPYLKEFVWVHVTPKGDSSESNKNDASLVTMSGLHVMPFPAFVQVVVQLSPAAPM